MAKFSNPGFSFRKIFMVPENPYLTDGRGNSGFIPTNAASFGTVIALSLY